MWSHLGQRSRALLRGFRIRLASLGRRIRLSGNVSTWSLKSLGSLLKAMQQ